MTVLAEDFVLANAVSIPKLGFGTWQIPDGPVAYEAVRFALQAGYRHVDTARAYGNEASVGRAVRDAGLDRGSVFVTSKLPAEIKTADAARRSFDTTMDALGLDRLDLYLIHAPWPWNEIGKDCREGNRIVWKVMEELYRAGRCRAIGVSNFDAADLTSLLEVADITPHVNQIRLFVGEPQEQTTLFCRGRNILVEGYSPLATGRLLNRSDIAAIARKYEVTLPRLCIRYVLQKGALPLPKSTHPEYIRENAAIDFVIEADDMAHLDGLTVPQRA